MNAFRKKHVPPGDVDVGTSYLLIDQKLSSKPIFEGLEKHVFSAGRKQIDVQKAEPLVGGDIVELFKLFEWVHGRDLLQDCLLLLCRTQAEDADPAALRARGGGD